MSHGPPPLASDFFAFNGQTGSDGGPSVMNNDQAAAAMATVAAQLQQQQQQQQQLQQQQQQQQQLQQATDNAMMMFFNEQPATFFNSFEDMSSGLAPHQPGSMFPPPPPSQALPSQSTTTSLPFDYGSMRAAANGDHINIDNSMQINGNTTDDSPTQQQDTDGVDGNVVMGGANEPGGGPMPLESFTTGGPSSAAGGAAGAGPAGGSALTEFTRRKNWPAKVVEELTDLLQIIEPNGRIRYASPNVASVLGYTPDEIAGQSLTELTHPDDRSVFIADLNACIANASSLRMFVRLRKKDSDYAIVDMAGHAHIATSRFAPNPSNKTPFCQAVFLMCREYPTKNSNLLDSFLEHKMENERLRRRIDDLRREEASEDHDEESHTQSQSWVWRQNTDTPSYMAAASGAAAAAPMGSAVATAMANNSVYAANNINNNSMSMPPPMTPLKLAMMPGGGPNNVALTRENLEGIAARPADSLGDKMARYEGAPGTGKATTGAGSTAAPGSMAAGAPTGADSGPLSSGGRLAGAGIAGPSSGSNAATGLPMSSTADTIEMLTGLRYQEGERSRGLSTGNRSPRLIKGDAGIAFSVNRDQRSGDKKKKARLAEEYVCTDCGTLESPEWRKGPSGPKTLCNACGLRWAKKEKREKKKAAAAGVLGGVGVANAGEPVNASGGGSPRRAE